MTLVKQQSHIKRTKLRLGIMATRTVREMMQLLLDQKDPL